MRYGPQPSSLPFRMLNQARTIQAEGPMPSKSHHGAKPRTANLPLTWPEVLVLAVMMLSLSTLPAIPTLVSSHSHVPQGQRSDLVDLRNFLDDALNRGGEGLGGSFAAGDVLKSQSGEFVVPQGMSGTIGTIDFCVEFGGSAISRHLPSPEKGHCETLLLQTHGE